MARTLAHSSRCGSDAMEWDGENRSFSINQIGKIGGSFTLRPRASPGSSVIVRESLNFRHTKFGSGLAFDYRAPGLKGLLRVITGERKLQEGGERWRELGESRGNDWEKAER